MTLVPGAKLGSYEVLAPMGAGGMGEVYGQGFLVATPVADATPPITVLLNWSDGAKK
jgi:hypothetical protein